MSFISSLFGGLLGVDDIEDAANAANANTQAAAESAGEKIEAGADESIKFVFDGLGDLTATQQAALEQSLAFLAAGQEEAAMARINGARLAGWQQQKFLAEANAFLEPYNAAGQSALPVVVGSLENAAAMLEPGFEFEASPGLKEAMDEGVEQMVRQMSATGVGVDSGNTAEAAATIDAQLLYEDYWRTFGAYLDIAEAGNQTAAVGLGAGAQQSVNTAGVGRDISTRTATAANLNAADAINIAMAQVNATRGAADTISNAQFQSGLAGAGITTDAASDQANLELAAALGQANTSLVAPVAQADITGDIVAAIITGSLARTG